LLELRRVARIVASAKPQLVHLHSSKAGLAGRLALRGRLPTIFQPHGWSFDASTGPVSRGAAAWERLAARWAALILCVSEAEQRRGEEHGIHATWRMIPNGVDLAALIEASTDDRSAARARLELEERPTVVCVGRLCREKGQDILLEAWPRVLSQVPEAILVLVGDGRDADGVRRLAGDGVRFAGWRTDVGDWLAAADVVAVPSRTDGMSVAMLEAMARGRAVVATEVGGAAEALGETGTLVPGEDPSALAFALSTQLLDPDGSAAMGHAARARAERFHDLKTTTQAVADLYAELLGQPASSSTGPTPL
jgi:glycosyltransferase involved in cell wall biosynthesis